MPVLYEVVELANGDVALQREGDSEGQPLVTMRFSTELLRFLRNGKLDIAKIMIEAGLEEVAKLAADFNDQQSVVTSEQDQSGDDFSSDALSKAEDSLESLQQPKKSVIAKKLTYSKPGKKESTGKASLRDMDRRSTRKTEDDLLEVEAVSHLIH